MLTSATDGIIYQWSLLTGQRQEILTKESSIRDFIYLSG